MSVADDFRCLCGERLVLDWEHQPVGSEPVFTSYPLGERMLDRCPGCGADLEEVLMEQIEQEERDYGEPWAAMVNCGTVVKPREA